MSRLSGSITNTQSSANRSGKYESSGSVIAKRCLHCGEEKITGKSHPKCSPLIQLDMQVQKIMDKINGYGVTA
jgi:hypothetical protein